MTPQRWGGSRKSGVNGTELAIWDTREPLSDGFAAPWRREVAASAHAHFEFDLDYLVWEAGRGRHARAVLADGAGRRGLLILRWENGRWISGWPWRWCAFVGGAEPGSPLGMTAGDATWIYENASRLAAPHPLALYLPHAPGTGVPGWLAGSTVMQDLQHADTELFDGMEPSKRRLARRAMGLEVDISTAVTDDDFRSFHRLQQLARSRRGQTAEATPETITTRGELWREWELPWMWLLVARHGGELVAGVGDGVLRGGMLQGRSAASSLEARRLGVTVLLGYEEARRGRDQGHRWMNHGGDTPFKREMCGRLGRSIRTYGWLGGGRAWHLWQRGEAALLGLRPKLARLRRRLGWTPALSGVVRMVLAGLTCWFADAVVWT